MNTKSNHIVQEFDEMRSHSNPYQVAGEPLYGLVGYSYKPNNPLWWLAMRIAEWLNRIKLVVLFIFISTNLYAQVVTNPNFIAFDSPDHYLQSITSYRIDFKQSGAQLPFTGFDIPSGSLTVLDPNIVKLQVNLNQAPAHGVLVSIPFGTQCTASIIATNTAGTSTRSVESNFFDRALLIPRAILNVTVSK